MTDRELRHQTFANGLTLVAEPIPSVESASWTLLIPAGSAYDPSGMAGTASLLSEWLMRGAGPFDSRQLLETLDGLGVNHGINPGVMHTSLTAATLGKSIIPSLEVFADVLRRPHLGESELEPIRELALQSLQSLEDDPASKALYELRRIHYPAPLNQPSPGTLEGVRAVDAEALRTHFQRYIHPEGAIVGVAGAIDWDPLCEAVERLFGDWPPQERKQPESAERGPHQHHIAKTVEQTQIAIASPSVPVSSPEYYPARALVSILGGYSSARLFTEVREKRGLCYAVSASHESLRDRGTILVYAGTSNERAQETLDVTLAEIDRLSREGITPEELETMRAGLKSSLIMQQESSLSRSAALASDWYHLGRVQPLSEIAAQLDALSVESIGRYASTIAGPAAKAQRTLLTLGPAPLNPPSEMRP